MLRLVDHGHRALAGLDLRLDLHWLSPFARNAGSVDHGHRALTGLDLRLDLHWLPPFVEMVIR